MTTTSKEIIEYIEREYPKENQIELKNLSDLNFETSGKWLNQYIIGVTPKDQFGSGIDHYKYRMKDRLSKVSSHFECLPWPFRDYEVEELKTALSDLSNYFEADLDIPKMIGGLKMRRDNGDLYYLVVTVVQHPILYIA